MTHDNADFDAVASCLAAHKLMPSALPVLPQRINRNVRHFMALYWESLSLGGAEVVATPGLAFRLLLMVSVAAGTPQPRIAAGSPMVKRR